MEASAAREKILSGARANPAGRPPLALLTATETGAALRRGLQPSLSYGFVAAELEGTFTVMTDEGAQEATQALSCLLKPEKGDHILLCSDGQGPSHILSVLHRPAEKSGPMSLIFEGPVKIGVRKGGLEVATDSDVAVTSRASLALNSRSFQLNAADGTARVEKLSLFGKLVHGQIERLHVIADAVDSIFRRSVQRLTSSFRYVEEHEEVQSASTRFLVDGTLTMQTKNTVQTAEGHIRMDAKQIHLG